MSLACADLLAALHRSQLLSPAQLHTLSSRNDQPLAAADELTADLLRRKWVTPYQLELLTTGRLERLRVGPFVLLERYPGRSTVFMAQQGPTSSVVALKLIEAPPGTAFWPAFEHMTQQLASLRHPHLRSVITCDEAGERPFLLLEHITGLPVDLLIEKGGPLPVLAAGRVAYQAGLALQYLHEQKSAHHDVRPANLFYEQTTKQLKLIGLEAAPLHRLTTGTSSHSGGTVVFGVPDFVAPEQARDLRAADSRADQYSLGCTLFFLLTGQPPYGAAGSPAEKLQRHISDPIPDVRTLRPEVPAALGQVIRKLLAKKPDERYPTPGAAAQAIAVASGFQRAASVPKWVYAVGAVGIVGVIGASAWWASSGPSGPVSPAVVVGPAAPVVDIANASQYVKQRVTVEFEVKSVGTPEKGIVYLNTIRDHKSDPKAFVAIITETGVASFRRLGITDFRRHFLDQRLRVTGTVEMFINKPKIDISDPSQVEILPR
jgi:serine/threonine-protein kinase